MRGTRVQLMVTLTLLMPAQHNEQLAPILLSSALPLHSAEVLLSQSPFRTLFLRWEGSEAALRSRKVLTWLPGMRI